MPQDGKDQDKIEVFKSGEVLSERRRVRFLPPRLSESEKPPNLLAIWNVIRKRRWTVLTAFFVMFAVVLVGTLEETPVYRAKALLEIERENPGLVTPEEVFQLDDVSDEYLETQYKILNSDDLAERVIDQLGLEKVEEFRPPVHSWLWNEIVSFTTPSAGPRAEPPGHDPDFRETVLARFQDRLDIKPIRHSLAVEVNFESRDPGLAVRVVDALTAVIIHLTQGSLSAILLLMRTLSLVIRREQSFSDAHEFSLERPSALVLPMLTGALTFSF